MTNKLTLVAALMILGFSACKNKNDQARLEANNFNSYVDSVNGMNHVYTEENWQAIDKGYTEREARLQEQINSMEADDKAKAEESRQKYAALKATYEQNLAKAKQDAMHTDVDSRQILRDRLFGEGKISADMQFGFVNASNVLSTYETFVNTVDANKDSYSREDWDEIKVLYEALDTRKNEIEKEMSGPDNRKIASLKIKFTGIKAANRPGTKGDENADAKEMSK